MTQTQPALVSSKLYLNTSTGSATSNFNYQSHGNFILDGFENNGTFELLTAFNYSEKIQVTFGVNDKYKAHYILIKGLLTFYRFKELGLSFNRHEKTITVDLRVSNLELLKKLMYEVSNQLSEELKFKAKLKQIIAFEQRYKEEASLLYQF